MPRDDRSEAADGDGDEHGPVRISGGQIDQRRRGRAEGDEHRVPVPPQQQAGAEDQQRPPEKVQGDAFAVLGVRRELRAAQHEDGQQQGGTPRPPVTAPAAPVALVLAAPSAPPRWPVPPPRRSPAHTGDLGVRCSSMTVTLDGTGRRWRQPGEVITRTPHGVPPGPSTDHHPVVVRDRPCRSPCPMTRSARGTPGPRRGRVGRPRAGRTARWSSTSRLNCPKSSNPISP